MTSSARAQDAGTEKAQQPGWDALSEDVLGLSFRGLKTIGHMIVRPADVVEAAFSRDWLNQYTPSLRLVMSLIAAMLLLRVFWAAEDSAMFQSIIQQLEALEAQGVEVDDPAAAATVYFTAFAIVFPFAYLIAHLLMALMTRVWGKGISTVVRLRLYFATIIPAVLVSIAGMLVTPYTSTEQILLASTLAMIVSLVVLFVTYFRGMSGHIAKGRVWRGIVFALIVTLGDLITSVVASALGGAAAGYILAGGSLPFID